MAARRRRVRLVSRPWLPVRRGVAAEAAGCRAAAAGRPSRRASQTPATVMRPRTSRIGSQTIRNQIPALATPWRMEIRLAAASSTVVAGCQSLLAVSTARTGVPKYAVSVA